LICGKTLKLLGGSDSEDKKSVNKNSRIGTHPSKNMRQMRTQVDTTQREKQKCTCYHCLPGAPVAENDCVSSLNECF